MEPLPTLTQVEVFDAFRKLHTSIKSVYPLKEEKSTFAAALPSVVVAIVEYVDPAGIVRYPLIP